MKNNLLLLHGALGSQAQFLEWKGKLGRHFNVYTFNFSGHGGKPLERPFSIELFVRDTLDYMDTHQLESVFLFGYSMGGYVALKLAHDYPERVEKIITLGTKFHWNPEAAAKEVKMMNPEIIEQKIPKYAAMLKERHQPEDWKKIMTHTGEMMTLLGAGKAMTSEEFKCIFTPALICIGTEDHMVTREESALVAGYLIQGQLKIIDGFKHPFESIDPEVMSGICLDFYTEPI
jgi:pimeloyl-ACP methyl ester carboxylesterase